MVCIPARDQDPLSAACVRTVVAQTPAEVPILVLSDPGGLELERELLWVSTDLATAVRMAGRADVAVVHPQCLLASGWLAGLRGIADADARIASVTALTLHSGELGDAVYGVALEGLSEAGFEQAAAAVRSAPAPLRPRVPDLAGCCVYICRRALDLVGGPDPGFFPAAAHELQFSQRCIHKGLFHVLADDVAVGCCAPVSPPRIDHRASVDRSGPLARSLGRARRSLTGLTAVIDARVLSGPVTGTQVQVLEVISALACTEKVALRVLVPRNLNERARAILARHPSVRLVSPEETEQLRATPADIVHRPYQVNNPGDLPLLASIGQRLIVTHQDLISYYNPAYFADARSWEAYRTFTRLALSLADRAIFLSEHVRDDAFREELVDPARAAVIRCGVDHLLDEAAEVPAPAASIPTDAQALLCIGTDFHHKNRVFALKMLAELQRHHQWDGYLMLAGATVTNGSSKPEETTLLSGDRQLTDRVVDCGPVSEAEKAWLMRRAALVLYPTIAEGFGLVPFEAANEGVACMWAPGTALDEVLPAAHASIVPWDAQLTADRALELLSSPQAHERIVAAAKAAGAELTWDQTATDLVAQYEAACDDAPSPAGAFERHHGVTSGGLSEDAMRLVGPGGALAPEVERPLLALAANPALGTPVFRLLTAAYRAGYWVRHRRR